MERKQVPTRVISQELADELRSCEAMLKESNDTISDCIRAIGLHEKKIKRNASLETVHKSRLAIARLKSKMANAVKIYSNAETELATLYLRVNGELETAHAYMNFVEEANQSLKNQVA